MTLREQDVRLRIEATVKLQEAIKHLDGAEPDMMRAELEVRQALAAVLMVREIDGSKG